MSSLFNKPIERSIERTADGQITTVTPTPAPAMVTRPPEASAPAPARSYASVLTDRGAHLDRGTRVSGKLSFDGPVLIDGEVDGEINAKDTVTVGESAVVTAGIHAGSVLVAGRVSGNITATDRIELRPTARVECDLVSPIVVIQEGAQFEGHCSMRADGARSERKAPAQHERSANNAGQKQGPSSQSNAA